MGVSFSIFALGGFLAWDHYSSFLEAEQKKLEKENKITYVVAAKDLGRDVILTSENVAVREFNKIEAPSYGIKEDDFTLIEKKRLCHPLKAGDILTLAFVAQATPEEYAANKHRWQPSCSSFAFLDVELAPSAEAKQSRKDNTKAGVTEPEALPKFGRTGWDVMVEILSSPLLAIVLPFMIWFIVKFIHRVALPGSEVSLAWGLVKYNKAPGVMKAIDDRDINKLDP